MAGKRATREQQAPQPAAEEQAPVPEAAPAPDAQPEQQPPAEQIEEIEVLDGGEAEAVDGDLEEDEYDDEDDGEELASFGEALFDPVMLTQQVTQLLVTEDGVPVVDVLQGIQDSLDKQNKILYKLVSVIEAHAKARK